MNYREYQQISRRKSRQISVGNVKVGGTLTGSINRSDWGLVWNVPLGSGGAPP